MATYEYQCRVCGRRFDVVKPASRAGQEEPCPLGHGPSRRLYSRAGFIMRPGGYALKPADPRYADFRRELELGEVRDPDENSRLGDGWTPPPPRPKKPIKFDEQKMQNLHELVRTAWPNLPGVAQE